MQDYEQLGAFYLGRRFDQETGEVTNENLLYDAKDLTTHAICVGMTGSGKSGLGVALIEEAIIDNIPVIVIDPKGDMGNLLLTFPQLKTDDFLPWMDASDAARKGRTINEHAKATADMWRKGLGEWGQQPERIGRFEDAAERVIYTPGSRAGRPLTILKSFDAPPAVILQDEDALRDRIMASVSGLLALLGIQADPLRSREHILISTLLDRAWRDGHSLDLAGLIRSIQSPPFERIGVFDLDTFYPPADRLSLAMTINNLLASPGFSAWAEGDALDVNKLLYTAEGKPKLSILSIAHLSEAERMSFVTLFLGEMVTWMRSQPGSRTLRAMLYMDEVFGYFPPVANPPSKRPMLTLLKQARAYGLGAVLATQNPVDLDYKGLSNCGTWFIGRLQTERDKQRVLEGLEGASVSAGSNFDRGAMERTLAGLGSRVFMMNNVHEDQPVLFHTRWVLSYLAGPMTRDQIRSVSQQQVTAQPAAPGHSSQRPAPARVAAPVIPELPVRPQLPAEVREGFLPPSGMGGATGHLVYRPKLLAEVMLHYANSPAKVDEWKQVVLLAEMDETTSQRPWDDAEILEGGVPFMDDEPDQGIGFSALPAICGRKTSYTRWEKMLKTHVYRSMPMKLWKCRALKLVSIPGEDQGTFRGRMRDRVRENRDLKLEKLRTRYAPKLARVEERIRTAEQRVDKEEAQYAEQKNQAWISAGSTVLGALFGRKVRSSGNVGRAASTMRRAGRVKRERDDIGHAMETLETRRQELADLEAEFETALEEVRGDMTVDAYDVEEVTVNPRKTDIGVDNLQLVWGV